MNHPNPTGVAGFVAINDSVELDKGVYGTNESVYGTAGVAGFVTDDESTELYEGAISTNESAIGTGVAGFAGTAGFVTNDESVELNDGTVYLNAATCPDCGAGMVRFGSCFSCQSCGFESCST